MPRAWMRGVRNAAQMATVWCGRHLRKAPHCLPILHAMVTDQCNLRCAMCGACDHRPGDHGLLTSEEWKGVIRSAAGLRTALISVTGGEPFLREDLFEIVAYAKEKGLAVHLNTNGTLLTKRNVDVLRESHVDTLSVSVDGPNAETHEALRGKDTFERAISGIRRVRQDAPAVRVGLNFLITRGNLHTMMDMVPFAESLGVHQMKFAPVHLNLLHQSKSFGDTPDLVFREDDLDALDAELRRLRTALSRSRLHTSSKYFFRGIRKLYEPPGARFYCYAGYASCVVDAQGFVAPCFDKQGTVSIRDASLDEVWLSPAFQRLRDQVALCTENCWDTTNAEISLRFSVGALLGDAGQFRQDLHYYLRVDKT